MSKNPKYIKIMSDLESQIKNNELKPGDQIPTEKNLCEMYENAVIEKMSDEICHQYETDIKHYASNDDSYEEFIKEFEKITNLPLTNYYLTERQIRQIFNYKI